MIDVRALANVILDQADSHSKSVTNMALNKIIYFVHCDYLLEKLEPLVGAKIEAWPHGPVFREIYHQFKEFGDEPICSRAMKVDVYSGESIIAELQIGSDDNQFIKAIIDRYIHLSAAHLRKISHVAGGPWDKVWWHEGRTNPGMKISNDLIRSYYSPGVRQ